MLSSSAACLHVGCSFVSFCFRSHGRDPSGKLFPSSSPQVFKDHTAGEHAHQSGEQKLEKSSERAVPEWANVEGPARAGALPHPAEWSASGSTLSSDGALSPSAARSWSPRVRAAGLTPDAAPLAQQHTAGPQYYPETSPPRERGARSARGADGCQMPKPVCQNPPPPLPPKKYTTTSVPQPEKNHSAPDARLTEPLRANPAGPAKHRAGAVSEAGPAVRARASDDRPRDAAPREPPGATRNCPALSSASESLAGLGAAVPALSQPDIDPSPACPRGTVSLTTYFSVDSCMTDTYRLKYHQRPKLCFPESSGFSHENSVSQSERGLGPVPPTSLGSHCPEHRHKPSLH